MFVTLLTAQILAINVQESLFFFRFLKDEAKYCNDNVHKALICEPRDLPVKGGDGR